MRKRIRGKSKIVKSEILTKSQGFRILAAPFIRGFARPAFITHMLTIRLSRVGKTKQPSYRLIVSEKTKDPWGDSLELLGTYQPLGANATVSLNADRIKYWISKGAQTSDTVRNLLIDQKIIEGEKSKKVSITKRRQAKIDKKKAA